MKRKSIYTALLSGLFIAPVALAAPAALVTSNANDGLGSLREALASGATKIEIDESVGTIFVTETLKYTSIDPLKLVGSGQIIDGSGLTDNLAPIFAVMMGADLSMSDLDFEGGGGYDFDNQGGGKGIFVKVPTDREGVVSLQLTNVSVFGVGNHGIHVSDCTLADACGSGGGGGGEGSPASVEVSLVDVLVDGAGFGKADADGVRVDERGDGDIFFSAVNSRFMFVGADGVELDEGNDGSVLLQVRNNLFEYNGEYCLGDDQNNLSDACNDDGDPDVDDGFDVDEAGPGSIMGFVRNNYVLFNYDEGLDFDEEDAGGFDVIFASNVAIGNEDEGLKLSEEDGGDITATLRSHYSESNNGSKEGIEIEEEDGGIVTVVVTGSTFIGGEDEELKIGEDDDDGGTVKMRGTDVMTDLEDSLTEI
mgnify:CR=1 FL=1